MRLEQGDYTEPDERGQAMSLTAAALRLLAAKGLTFDEIVAVAEANSEGPAKSSAATRQARYRARKQSERVTRDVTRDATQTVTDDVTNRNNVTPLARVEDKPLILVPTCNPISSFSDDDWPKDEPHGFAKRLAMMAGPGLGDPAKEPGLTTTSPEIIRWRQMGCSWSLDVVPTIQARTLKARDRPITGWNLLTRDVLAAKSRRERPVDIPAAGGGSQFMSAGQQAAAMRQAGVENLLRKLGSE